MLRQIMRNIGKAIQKARRKAAYKEYINSPQWDAIRRLALQRAGYRCQRCGATDRVLQVHHKNYDRFGGHELSIDLQVLCIPCHKLADKERKAAIKNNPRRPARKPRIVRR